MKKIILIGILLTMDFSLCFLFLRKEQGRWEEAEAKASIGELLLLAKEPIGKTMYIWGGGWNEEDTGAGNEACTLGMSPRWEKFAKEQNEGYDWQKTRYQIHDGLDCSGYIGWVIYNLFEKENGRAGYVAEAAKMAGRFAEKGFGTLTKAAEVRDWRAGDIMSMDGHVWMALGSCKDGSVVLVHSSPPGVRLCGTGFPLPTKETGDSAEKSEAVKLAERYMKAYYPEWYERYPEAECEYRYLTDSDRMRWSEEILSDQEGLRRMDAEEVLAWMFG